MHQNALNGLNTLENLDISHNQLNGAPSISSVKNTLMLLDLSWNRITHISDKYFHSFNKIKNIYLGHNQLIEIPNLEHISKTIFRLSLPSNNISNVIPMYGIRFPILHALTLQGNQIKSFCFPPVTFAPRVKNVDLEANYLQVIDFSHERSTRMYMHEVSIYLGHNPWFCNGSLGWTRQCTQETYINAMTCFDWLMLDGMICASPPEAHGLTPKEAGRILFIYVIHFS